MDDSIHCSLNMMLHFFYRLQYKSSGCVIQQLSCLATYLQLQRGALPLQILSAVHVRTLSPLASRCPLRHEYVAVDSKVFEGCETLPFKGVLKAGQVTAEQRKE